MWREHSLLQSIFKDVKSIEQRVGVIDENLFSVLQDIRVMVISQLPIFLPYDDSKNL